MLISIKDYASMHGRDPATVRQKALRGGFRTAKKIGRDWLIDDSEPYEDIRIKNGKYTAKNRKEKPGSSE